MGGCGRVPAQEHEPKTVPPESRQGARRLRTDGVREGQQRIAQHVVTREEGRCPAGRRLRLSRREGALVEADELSGPDADAMAADAPLNARAQRLLERFGVRIFDPPSGRKLGDGPGKRMG